MSLLTYKIIILGLITGAFFSFLLVTNEDNSVVIFFMFLYLIVSAICTGVISLLLYILGVN